MSGKIVGLVFDFYPSCTNGELLVAVKMGDNAHDDGTHIYPSVATLAELTRQSERSVQNHIRKMLASGWLVLVREARGGGRGGGYGRPREYRIDPVWIKAHDSRVPDSERPTWTPRAQNPAQEMGANSAPISGGKRVQIRKEMGATAVAEMGATAVAPEPSLTVIGTIPPDPPPGGASGFEQLAAEYPRKSNLAEAARRYHSLAPDPDLHAQIIAAVRAWTRSPEWQREDGRFVPLLHKWLSGKRWLDVPGFSPPAAPPAAPRPREPKLSPDQLAINAQRAREARAALGLRERRVAA
jgi:hypothetical protein